MLNDQEAQVFGSTVIELTRHAADVLARREEIALPAKLEFDKLSEQERDLMLDVQDRLWTDEGIYRESAAACEGLSGEQKALVDTWTNASLTSKYFVSVRDGQAYFCYGDKVLAVEAIATPFAKLLGDGPAFVDATLLPFAGKVTYSIFINVQRIRDMALLFDSLADQLDCMIDQAILDDKIIRTSDEFAEVAAKAKEKAFEEQAKRMMEEAEHAIDGPGHVDRNPIEPGKFHKSKIAGKRDELREDWEAGLPMFASWMMPPLCCRKQKLDPEALRKGRKSHWDAMLANAHKGEPLRSLSDLLAIGKRYALTRLADALGMGGRSDAAPRDTADIAWAIEQELLNDPHKFNAVVGTMGDSEIDLVRDIVKQGGMVTYTCDDYPQVLMPVSEHAAVLYMFDPGWANGNADEGAGDDANEGLNPTTGTGAGELAVVVPDELVRAADLIDWDGIKRERRRRNRAVDIVEALIRQRGVIRFDDLYQEYREMVPDGLEWEDFAQRVAWRSVGGTLGCITFLADNLDEAVVNGVEDHDIDADFIRKYLTPTSYLVDWELANCYLHEQRGIEWSPAFFGGTLEGSLIDEYVSARGGVEPRPLPDGVENLADLRRWIGKLPAVHALVDYMDEHVPDGVFDDEGFVESNVAELIEYLMGDDKSSSSIEDYFKVLEDGLFVPTDEMRPDVVKLLVDLANALPLWANNGWSEDELAKRQPGYMPFFRVEGEAA